MKNITKNIFFIRHGETKHNINGVIQGSEINPPLDIKGIETSHYLGRFFTHIDTILTSPSLRAVQTANIISDYNGAKIITLEGLNETNSGILSGKTFKEFEDLKLTTPYVFKDSLTGEDIVCNTGKDIMKYIFSNDERYSNASTPGGETKKDVKKRASDAIEKFINENKYAQNILIITHSGVVKYLIMGNERFKNFKTIKHREIVKAKYEKQNLILTKLIKPIEK